MATPTRRGLILPVSIGQQLVAADDLDGTAGTRRSIDVTGATRVIVAQGLDAVDGTAGVDVVVISKDGGSNWAAVTDCLPLTADDISGTVQAGAALNTAGVEPTTVYGALFKCGPYEGPTLLRICRKTGAAASPVTAVTWVTHAPPVHAFIVGSVVGAPTTVTHTSD